MPFYAEPFYSRFFPSNERRLKTKERSFAPQKGSNSNSNRTKKKKKIKSYRSNFSIQLLFHAFFLYLSKRVLIFFQPLSVDSTALSRLGWTYSGEEVVNSVTYRPVIMTRKAAHEWTNEICTRIRVEILTSDHLVQENPILPRCSKGERILILATV